VIDSCEQVRTDGTIGPRSSMSRSVSRTGSASAPPEPPLAGLTRADALFTGRRIAGWLRVPAVEVQDHESYGRCLRWAPPYEWKRPGGRVLENFLEIAETSREQDFLDFASRWGVLGIWRFRRHSNYGFEYAGPLPARWPAFHYEPIELWRWLVRRFKACRDLAAHVHKGKRTPVEFWEHLYHPAPKRFSSKPPNLDASAELFTARQFQAERQALAPRTSPVPPNLAWSALIAELNILFGFSDLLPWLEVQGLGRAALNLNLEEMSVGNLYGFLVCRLAADVTQPHGLKPCRACGRYFTPERSSMLYCPRLDCQRAKSSKTSDEHRHRKARALALYADGVPAEEIAEREGSRLKIVRRWIAEASRPPRKRKAGK